MRKVLLIGAPLAAAAATAAVLLIDNGFKDDDGGKVEAAANAPTRHDRIRQFNHAVTNPFMRQVARLGFSYPAVIVAPGRNTGTMHETPVFATPAGDGFVIPLPYGDGADWCQNVLAAGGCTMRYRNRPVALTRPRIVEDSAVALFIKPRRLAIWRRWGIDHFLSLDVAAQS